jgi:hypothetical protein
MTYQLKVLPLTHPGATPGTAKFYLNEANFFMVGLSLPKEYLKVKSACFPDHCPVSTSLINIGELHFFLL